MQRVLLAATALLLSSIGFAQSAVPVGITYQGRVTDGAGNLIGAGTPVNRLVTFRIYNAATGGTRLWSEQQVATITNGEFNVIVGSGSAVAGETNVAALDAIFTSNLTATTIMVTPVSTRFLGVTVDDGTVAADPEITPRQQLYAAPYALRARTAETVASGAVNATMLANGAVGTIQIADLNVTTAKIADAGVTTAKVADASVTTAKIANLAVDATKLADASVATAKIADGAVTAAKIAAGAVDATKLADASVTTAKIAAGAVDATKIPDGAITSSKIADSAVVTADIADGAVATAKLANTSVTAGKLASDVGGASGTYNFFRVNGGNSQGFIFGAFNQVGDGINYTYNAYNNNSAWTVPVPAGGQSRMQLGYGSVDFYTAPGSSAGGGVQRMQINQDGRISLGGNLHDANTTVLINNISGRIYPLAIQTSAGGWFYFEHNGNAYKSTGSSWSVSSDARLKKDVVGLEGALDHLLELRGVQFRFKDGQRYADGVQTGFIAQEVQDVFPDWVSTTPDGYLAVGAKGFEALTVEALRELRAEKDAAIAERDRAIVALEQRVRELESSTAARLAELEKRLEAVSAPRQ